MQTTINREIGIIINISHNHCYVQVQNEILFCFIRAKLRQEYKTLLVGDRVTLTQEENSNVVEKIFPRKNTLYRPKMANIDQIMVICALHTPEFNPYLINKLLTFFNYQNIPATLVITKIDLIYEGDNDLWDKINSYPVFGYPVFKISNNNDSSLHSLEKQLNNKITVLTGLSGVGKSTTLNNLINELNLKTQTTSLQSGKGKHTTTNSTLYTLNYGGMVADTPGFADFRLENLTKLEIAHNFPSFKEWVGHCHFRTCLHLVEKNCAVQRALSLGQIPNFFYENYQKIILEAKEQTWKNKK